MIRADEIPLQEHVSQDVEADSVGALEASVARPVAVRCVVDVGSGDGMAHAADLDGKVGQGGGAREDVAAVGRAI